MKVAVANTAESDRVRELELVVESLKAVPQMIRDLKDEIQRDREETARLRQAEREDAAKMLERFRLVEISLHDVEKDDKTCRAYNTQQFAEIMDRLKEGNGRFAEMDTKLRANQDALHEYREFVEKTYMRKSAPGAWRDNLVKWVLAGTAVLGLLAALGISVSVGNSAAKTAEAARQQIETARTGGEAYLRREGK